MKYYFVVFIFLIFGLVLISDNFDLIDASESQNTIIKSLEDTYKFKILISDSVHVKILPTPQIVISDISVLYDGQNVFKASDITLHTNFLSLIKLILSKETIEISALDFDEGDINYDLITKYLDENSDIQKPFDGKNFVIKFSSLHIDSKFKNLNIINSTIKHESSKIIGDGEIVLNKQNIKYSIDSQIKDNYTSDINLSLGNKNFNSKISLNDFSYSKLKLDNGKIDLKIIDLTHNKEDNKSKLDNDLEFLCSIKSNDDEIYLDEVDFKGEVLEKPSLTAKIYKVSDKILELQMWFFADSIYLDTVEDFLSLSEISLNQVMKDIFDFSPTSENFNLNLNARVKKIHLKSGEINNFDLSTYTVMGRTLIDKLNLDCPGDSNLRIAGTIFGNNIRQKFNGIAEVGSEKFHELLSWYKGVDDVDFRKSKKLYAISSVFAMQNILKASDFDIKLDNVIGNANISLYEIPYSAPVKRFFIQVENLDLDEIGFTSALDIYIRKLYQADDDKNGEKYFKLTNADSWLRKFNKQLSLDLTMHNLNFRDQKIGLVNTVIDASSSLLNIKSLKIDDPRINGEIEFKFRLPVLRPQITLRTDLSYLDTNFFTSLLPKEEYLGKYDPNDKSINFYSANSYDGKFDIKIDEMVIDNDTTIKELNASGTLKLGYLLAKDFNFNAWNGNIKSNFGIILSTNKPVFTLSFNVYNINPRLPMRYITSLDKIDGYLSIAGIIKGNLREIGNNQIYGKTEFAGALISWDGFNLGKIIEITDGEYTTESKLQGVDYYSKYGKSLFDSMTGSMNIIDGVVKMDNIKLTNNRVSGLSSINYDLASRAVSSVGAFAFIPAASTDQLTITTKTHGKLPTPKENTIDISKVEEFIKKPQNKPN